MPGRIKSEQDVPQRKRGRPSGKNRTPLSLEERRARNAQYEKERRNETAEAFIQLAEAVGCDSNISNAELLATVISQIQMASERHSSDNIEDLKRINDSLEAQIQTLQGRLGHEGDESLNLIDDEIKNTYVATEQQNDSDTNADHNKYATEKHTKKRKRGSNTGQQRKRKKFHSVQWSDDSGIESQSPQPEGLHSVQYITETPSVMVNEDTVEPVETATQAQIYLSSELYQQLYPEPVGSGTVDMEFLTQSLITIPTITPPQQNSLTEAYVQQNTEPPDTASQLNMKPFVQELMPLFNTELKEPQIPQLEIEPPVQSFLNENVTVQEIQPNLDFLTDSEKGMITEWILNGDFSGNCGEPQLTGYPVNYTPGYC